MYVALLLVVASDALDWVLFGLVWFGWLVCLFVCLFVCLSVSLSLSSSLCLSSSLSPSPSLSLCLSLSPCLSFAGARKTLLRCRKNTALHKKHRLGAGKTPWVLEKHRFGAAKTPLPRCWKNTAGVEQTPWCSKNTSSVLRKHSFVDAEKTPPGAEKTLGPQKKTFWCYKNTLFRVLENTAGADKTPWMLRKSRVLKKHLLDAEKVPDAGKTPFQCWKNPQPFKKSFPIIKYLHICTFFAFLRCSCKQGFNRNSEWNLFSFRHIRNNMCFKHTCFLYGGFFLSKLIYIFLQYTGVCSNYPSVHLDFLQWFCCWVQTLVFACCWDFWSKKFCFSIFETCLKNIQRLLNGGTN